MFRAWYFSFLAGLLLILIPLHCKAASCDSTEDKMLAELSKISFLHLYGGEDTIPYINTIWRSEDNRCAIIRILKEKKGNCRVRFFAAEILLDNCGEIPEGIDKTELGKLYAKAIRRNYTHGLNHWGMRFPEDTGRVGRHLIKIGEPAVPALRHLLNNRWAMLYSGSKSAEAGNGLGYRKKDVAAFYIIKIKGLDLELGESRSARNKTIRVLKKKLR